MYDVHRLRLLVELERRGTLTAVAQALHYSASTVSHQLSQLEAEVGVALLEPSGRRVQLTPQAHVLVHHARAVIRELEAAEAAIARSAHEVAGTVRIAAFQTAMLSLVSPVITALRAAHPGVVVEVVQAEPEVALEALLTHEHDLVLAEEYPHQHLPHDEAILLEPLLEDPMQLALPRSSSSGDEPGATDPWERARELPWATEPAGSASREWLTWLCREQGIEPQVRFVTDDLLVQRRLVADGHAAAILPALLHAESALDAEHGVESDIALHPVPGSAGRRRILTAVRAAHAAHPALEACVRALQAQAMVLESAGARAVSE